MRTAEVLPAGAARAAALRRAGAACGCAALGYLVARSVLTALANALLALRVPGASLANPAGTGLAAAILLQAVVSALSLAAPFALLPLAGSVPAASPRRLNAEQWAGLFLLFWLLMMAGNLLAAALPGAGGGQMDLPASGLALAAAGLDIKKRREEHKVAIVFSDGLPNDMISGRKRSGMPERYVGDAAIRDTCFQVRKLRREGVHVLGIFLGEDGELENERMIYGASFLRIRRAEDFAGSAGRKLSELLLSL